MANTVVATYESGLLRLSKELPLREHQQVLVVVVPLAPETESKANAARVQELRERAEAWLDRQPPAARREPPASETPRHLDENFDAALAIRARTARFNKQQIHADIEKAIAEVRALSEAERARLDNELDQVLASLVTADDDLHDNADIRALLQEFGIRLIHPADFMLDLARISDR